MAGAGVNTQLAERIVHRWLIGSRGLDYQPRVVRRAMAFLERQDQARRTTPDEQRQLSLLAYQELESRLENLRRRAEARRRLADYIDERVLPSIASDGPDCRALSDASHKLRVARQSGTWGTRPDGSLITAWDDKSGLVRMDPDEAREEAQRLADRYAPFVQSLADDGYGLHYLVLTAPNVPAGELAREKARMFKQWVAFNRLAAKGKSAFPEIVGSLVVQEDPVGRNGEWHVHLNVLLVTRNKFHLGLYERIRRAWGWNAHMEPVCGDTQSIARAFRELVKYAVKPVPEKSERDDEAPAMTEWEPGMFREWFAAQRRFRRTRSYGALYGSRVPHPPKLDMSEITWHGVIQCSMFRCSATAPIVSIPGDNSTTRSYRGPP